jgi:hypothetical protein
MLGRRVLLFGVLAGWFTGVVPAIAKTPDEISVGDFALMVASRLGSAEGTGPLAAARAGEILGKIGANSAPRASSPLTEQDAVEFFRPFGITLQSRHPGEILGRSRASALLGIFGSTLSAQGGQADHLSRMVKQIAAGPVGFDDLTPLDCQSLVPSSPCGGGGQTSCNPCMDCCLNQLGLTGKDCGQLCQKKNLIVSPTDPTP